MTKTTIAFPLSMDLRRTTLMATEGYDGTFIIDANKRRVMTIHGQDVLERNNDADFIVSAVNAVARATGRTASALTGVGMVVHEDDLGVTITPKPLQHATVVHANNGTVIYDSDAPVVITTLSANEIKAESNFTEDFSRPPGAPDLSANGILRMILRTGATELEDPRCDLLEAIKRGAREVETAIQVDHRLRREERDADMRAHIADVERMMREDGLRKVVERAISNFSSPTMGQGSVHGGQAGFILYERDGVPFVVQAVCEAVAVATRAIAKRLRDRTYALTTAELHEIAQQLASLRVEPPALVETGLPAETATRLLSDLNTLRRLVKAVIHTIIPGTVQTELTRAVEYLDNIRARLDIAAGFRVRPDGGVGLYFRADQFTDDSIVEKRWSTAALAWVVDTFGTDEGCDQRERASRFLEEAIEVAHVLGVSFGAASALVTRTYLKRPVNSVASIRHELGQAEMTLALLVELFAATPPGHLGEREFHRVRALGEEFWRARHAAKMAGIESVASMAGVVSASDTIAIRDAAIEECARELEGRSDAESTAVRSLRALKTWPAGTITANKLDASGFIHAR